MVDINLDIGMIIAAVLAAGASMYVALHQRRSRRLVEEVHERVHHDEQDRRLLIAELGRLRRLLRAYGIDPDTGQRKEGTA